MLTAAGFFVCLDDVNFHKLFRGVNFPKTSFPVFLIDKYHSVLCSQFSIAVRAYGLSGQATSNLDLFTFRANLAPQKL